MMLTLNDGRSELWQWDTGRTLNVDADCSQVHFSNKVFGRSIDVDVVDGVASIPDILLQIDNDLTAWAFVGTAENGYTKTSKVFKVNKRNKPADYVFTPTGQDTLGEILNRIEDLEKRPSGDVSKEDIQNAVSDYFDENPLSVVEKDPTVPDWAKQTSKPKYTAKEVGAVATVNGTSPDESGNVQIKVTDSVEGSVLYTEQELTEEQQAQARTNIGAVSLEEVEELLGIEEEFSVSGEVVEFDIDVEPDTALEVISKIHRDETWGLSDKLVLHQVSSSNFVDLTSFLGGAGTVFEQNGLTATVNADSTVTIKGTNESSSSVNIIDTYNWSDEKVYPAGTYTVPNGFAVYYRAAQYPANVRIEGSQNTGTINISEPFRMVNVAYSVRSGVTVDVTLPLGLFRGSSIPETGYEYSGVLHTVTFDSPIYEGEFNWSTGELKDADGNTVGYYDSPKIKRLSGTNYFWTCFGENTVSNASNELGKVGLRLNEIAPEDTIPSICDFMFTPTTMEAAYSLFDSPFFGGGQFSGHELPVLTTKGTLSVKDADGNVKYSKYVEPMFNARGVADVLTHKGLEKRWSEKFYLNKDVVSTTTIPAPYDGAPVNYAFMWEFEENEFVNTGIPAKLRDIPMASPCFINDDSSEENINSTVVWNGGTFPAFFSYNAETGKYILTARGSGSNDAQAITTNYTKVYFYYQLETPYDLPFSFAMGIDAGDKISFEADTEDAQPYIDARVYRMSSGRVTEAAVDPTIVAFVPRNVEDAIGGMNNAARMLNMDDAVGGDATVQGYSWIGEGDGVTDYTVQIQSKIDELHTVSNGGTIHLGPGTYPISKSLIVYRNTRIIGDGQTYIEQKADNTHALVISGDKITIRDIHIKLSGKCTEFTACIYTNARDADFNTDPNFPENDFCQYCTIENVQLYGTYEFSYTDGLAYIPDDVKNYRGVGVYGRNYFNGSDVSITAHNLFAAVYDASANNCYKIIGLTIGYAVYAVGGGTNIYDVSIHTRHAKSIAGDEISLTKSAVYAEVQNHCHYTVRFGDSQYADSSVYFNTDTFANTYCVAPIVSSTTNSPYEGDYEADGGVRRRVNIIDKGRGNINVTPIKTVPFIVGNRVEELHGIGVPNVNVHGGTDNVLSGAGVWGTIFSNVEWTENGIALRDVCRYPKETENQTSGSKYLSVISNTSPSAESPIEIVIDISNRPIHSFPNLWIQFDSHYVAEEIQMSFDTTGDGTFNFTRNNFFGNTNTVFWYADHQEPQTPIYRIKISFTKAYSAENLRFQSSGHTFTTMDYNPNGLVGIVNIGMMHREPFGRAFLGECGGSLYGNVDMHQNTLKNLPNPVDDGDAVSKSYLEERLAALEALINGM